MKMTHSFGIGFLAIVLLAPALLIAQQDPPLPPCCSDIYYAGFNLGLALTLAREGEANDWSVISGQNRLSKNHMDNFLRFIDTACRYLETAHADCSRVNPAWVDWNARQDVLRGLAADIQEYGNKPQFRRAVGYLASARNGYAEALMVQIVADTFIHTATCEEKYFKIGFDLAEAQGCLVLAGDPELSEANRISLNDLSSAAIQRARDDI